MFKIAVVDDEIHFLKRISAIVEEIFTEYKCEYSLKPFLKSAEFLRQHEKISFDVIFLDIRMPGTDGFSVAEKLHADNLNVYIIFITSDEGCTVNSYDYHPFYFIQKGDKEHLRRKIDFAGMIMRDFLSALVFLVTIIPLRLIAGGYHARNCLICNLIFISVFAAVNLLSGFFLTFLSVDVLVLIIIPCFSMFYTFAPLEIENKNKLENTKKKTLHKIAVVCSVSLSFTALFASVFNMYYAAVIVFTMFFTAVFMLPVIIKIQMEGGA